MSSVFNRGVSSKIIGVVLFTLCSLLCFNNASAISPSLTVVPTGRDFETGSYECQYNEPASIPSGLWYCPATVIRPDGTGWSYLVRIGTSNTIETVAGNYYRGLVVIHSLEESPPILWTLNTTNDWILTDLRVISEDTERQRYFLEYASGNGAINGTSSSYAYSNFYEVILQAKNDGNYKWSFGFGNDVLWQPTSADLQLDNIVYLSKISEYSPDSSSEMNQKDNQDRSDIESQSSSTDSSASSSQSDVESASGSIISNITSIVGALNTSATNCNINLDTGNLQLTNVNLCSVPNEIRSLINNIMVLIVTVSVLLCSYSLIRQFLSLYESFLAGGKS